MSGRTLFEGESPKTQSIEAVKSLLAFVGRAADPLPSFVEMAGGVRLTLTSKKDGYYVTTEHDCSCPARVYHPQNPCKHMRAVRDAPLINTANFRPVMPEDERAAVVA